ncbi:hypothetical protein BKA62DRAFT_696946 [Auriculariales sp. MPI-PUGE-AT-0066]|nr:hypothetical protein BKA62DRAFT_696946 [Auriculariales sp. MPI-PUGE-AT-0066]
MSSGLLSYHTKIIETIVDPATSQLVLIARGLGLRTILCTLLRIYNSPQTLVLLVNASQDEEQGIGELLGRMGSGAHGLKIVTHQYNRNERKALYQAGGVISVTSRILATDMLLNDVPCDLVSGLIVLHAEKVTNVSSEAFIVRLYREKNQKGFIKAFTDQPEHITYGMFPLRSIMKELGLRTAHIYPRFHEDIQEALERRKADVVELYQPMTQLMHDIHESILICMNATLSELKRSNSTLDLEDLTADNANIRMFDMIVRKHLDPVWHKVGPRTKQLVGDLTTLRNLMSYLLSYDAVALHSYLEGIIHANSVNVNTGERRQNQSPWLLIDAADVMIKAAKRRCYITTAELKVNSSALDEDEEDWAALDEDGAPQQRLSWLPQGMEPVLEELPKWAQLVEPLTSNSDASDIVLVMCSSQRTCDQLNEYFNRLDPSASKEKKGHRMMERRLRDYIRWKARLNERDRKRPTGKEGPSSGSNLASKNGAESGMSEAMKRKDAARQFRAANRRRIRGGAPGGPASSSQPGSSHDALQPNRGTDAMGALAAAGEMLDESNSLATFLATQGGSPILFDDMALAENSDFLALQQVSEHHMLDEEDQYFGIIPTDQTVIIRVYADDADDMLLSDIKPRFIVIFEPNQEFIRRVEVYRSLNPSLHVRIYFMVYEKSTEEVKFLTSIRKEKDAFERIIKERASMLAIIGEDVRHSRGDAIVQQLSTRLAGGGRVIEKEPPRIIIDVREMNSALPNLLHATGTVVIPLTLTVGDYILSPDICVERKSIPDLIQSFNNGRLYTQCELMSAHYKSPMLLIEFEEHKAEVKSYAKGGKYPKKKAPKADDDNISITSIQSKLVLLTLSYPRLRVIWSSSPYHTAEIFKDLKTNYSEPDPLKAVKVGAEDQSEDLTQNQQPEDLLRSIPGITSKNVKHVMGKVRSIRELCELELARVQEILGNEPGKLCWEFLHRGDRS